MLWSNHLSREVPDRSLPESHGQGCYQRTQSRCWFWCKGCFKPSTTDCPTGRIVTDKVRFEMILIKNSWTSDPQTSLIFRFLFKPYILLLSQKKSSLAHCPSGGYWIWSIRSIHFHSDAPSTMLSSNQAQNYALRLQMLQMLERLLRQHASSKCKHDKHKYWKKLFNEGCGYWWSDDCWMQSASWAISRPTSHLAHQHQFSPRPPTTWPPGISI